MTQTTISLLSIREISKRFGATQALNRVSFDINRGEVLALLGANGAGKSTIIKILAKIYTADSGVINFGENGNLDDVKISFIHQDLGLVEWMTVAESIALGSSYQMKMKFINWPAVRRQAVEALSNVAPHISPTAVIKDLTRADRSLVAIARALYNKSEMLVLDEPTASLHASDCENLFRVLRNLRDEGVAIIYVSHRMDEIFKVADRTVVLRDGNVVEDGMISQFTPQELVKAIVGRENERFQLKDFKHGEVVLAVNKLCGPRVYPTTFELRRGEILGLVGLNGAGQREVGRFVAGALPKFSGEVLLNGKQVDGEISEFVDAGISLITSSRAEEGLFMELTVRENMFPNVIARGESALSIIHKSQEKTRTFEIDDEFNVKPRTSELAIATLSGGNQQKVILARWLSMQRSVIVLEEPTAGVDVGAKTDIYRLIENATQAGLSILLVSTDFEEVALMAHRALVFSEGKVTKELLRDQLTIQNLVAFASRADQGEN